MGRAEQMTAGRIGPAVQWAHNIAPIGRLWVVQIALTLKDHGLAVTAHVGEQFNALCGVNQHPAMALVRQGGVVTQLGNTQLVAHITWP